MTKVKEGIESMLSGKFGNLVFVQRQGKTYVRRAPQRKKDSSTPGMLRNQQRFAQIMKFCGQFKNSVIPRVWNLAAEGTSGFRLFQKVNSPAFDADGILTDPKQIKLSTGVLTLPEGLTVKRKSAGSSAIEVSWLQDQVLGGISLRDELLVVSTGEGEYSEIIDTGIIRDSLGGTIQLPAEPATVSHLHLFFGSKDGNNYSPDVCVEI